MNYGLFVSFVDSLFRELTLFWSKLQRRLDGSFKSFLERCLQFGTIAKTVYHLLYLIRVIQTEVKNCSFTGFFFVYQL